MCEKINYIFHQLHESDDSVRYLKRIARRQSALNRGLVCFGLITGASLVLNAISVRKLTNEVEELTRMKGE